MLLGEAKYLPWSCSRVDTAKTCLYKFHKVYLEGIKEKSLALSLGSMSHEIIALLLKDHDPSLTKAQMYMSQTRPIYETHENFPEVCKEVEELLPYMVTFVSKWKEFMNKKGIKKDRVENAYGITRELTRTSYTGYPRGDVYLRGVIDLWTYDPVTKTLYIVDHKTNKSILSKARVKESVQLNLYVAMLSIIFKMPWEKAVIGLNFLRKGKIVWAQVTPQETIDFMQIYLNSLNHLENNLYECDNSMIWPANASYKCAWCSFRNTCETFMSKV